MARQIALLRAVNVVGRNKVAMADLCSCVTALGCLDVRTLLQSGNVVFDAAVGGPAMEKSLEEALLAKLGLRTHVIVRSAAQWRRAIADNPFPEEARRDPGHLLAMVTKHPVSQANVKTLRSAAEARGGREAVSGGGKQVYIYFPDGVGRSRVTTALIERSLGTVVTGRNWNTVLKLADATSTD